jgi:hypothetical protein
MLKCRLVAGVFAEVVRDGDLWHRPVVAMVSIRRLDGPEESVADLRDLALVLGRVVADTGRRVSLDEVLAAFGHTRESLAVIPDDE